MGSFKRINMIENKKNKKTKIKPMISKNIDGLLSSDELEEAVLDRVIDIVHYQL